MIKKRITNKDVQRFVNKGYIKVGLTKTFKPTVKWTKKGKAAKLYKKYS